MARILLVDDHDLVRAGVKSLLEGSKMSSKIIEANNGDSALEIIAKETCDIVMLDIRMPGSSVECIVLKLKEVQPQARVIILTSLGKEAFPTQLLNMGIYGFVTKDSDPDLLLLALQKVINGERYVSPDIAKFLAVQVLNNKKQKPDETPFQKLSKREMQCLSLMAKGKTTQEIASALKIQAKTINTYRHRIYQKLDVNSDVELITLVARYNLLDEMRVKD